MFIIKWYGLTGGNTMKNTKRDDVIFIILLIAGIILQIIVALIA